MLTAILFQQVNKFFSQVLSTIMISNIFILLNVMNLKKNKVYKQSASVTTKYREILLSLPQVKIDYWKSPRGYSGFKVMEMIEWSQKSRPNKIPRASSKTPKNLWTKN